MPKAPPAHSLAAFFIGWQRLVLAHTGALLLLVTALYGQYLWNPLVFDDTNPFLVDGAGHQPISAQRFSLWQLRSLPNASLAWTLAVFGQSLIYFRLGNLLLHAAVVLALYGFILQLRQAWAGTEGVTAVAATGPPPGREDGRRADAGIAFAAALLFALHPVAVYAAGYLVQRTMLLATLFSLLALWVYARGIWQRSTGWRWLALPLYYLALFSKEHAVMLAVVFPLLSVALAPDWRARLHADKWLLLALWALALVVVVMKKQILGAVYEGDAGALLAQMPLRHPWPSSVLTQCWLFFRYLGLWLVPNTAWMSVDLRVPIAASWRSAYVLAGVVFLAWGALGAALLLRRGRAGLAGLAMLFPWLMFWTELASVRVQEPMVLYRSYLWMAGALAFAAALPPAALLRRHLLLPVGVVAVLLTGLSMERLQTFSHPYLLWDDAEKLVHGRTDLPGAARIYYNRGNELLRLKRPGPARADLLRALQLQPGFAAAYGNLGACYLADALWRDAQAAFAQAIALNARAGKPPEARYYLGRARAYEQLGQPRQAQLDYQMVCRISGRDCDKTP